MTCWKSENTAGEMKKMSCVISRLDIDQKIILELKERSIEKFQTEM